LTTFRRCLGGGRAIHAYPWVPLPIFDENSAHLMRGECINLIAGTKMTGPVALNDREQTGHLNKYRLVGHGFRVR